MVIDVTYNGNSIASLKSGETAIVECDGMKMTSDLTITAPAFEDSPLPIEVATADEMTALLSTAEVGAIYKYTGETTDTYENGALYVVESDVTLISFTIDGTTYQAEEGMTWKQWVESDYNTGNYQATTYHIVKDGDYTENVSKSMGVYVTPDDVIVSDYSYIMSSAGEPL